MRARYAALLSQRYGALAKEPSVNLMNHYLYRSIFPKIAAHIMRAQTQLILTTDLIYGAEAKLTELGYRINRREFPKIGQPSVVERVEVTIDWGHQVLAPAEPSES